MSTCLCGPAHTHACARAWAHVDDLASRWESAPGTEVESTSLQPGGGSGSPPGSASCLLCDLWRVPCVSGLGEAPVKWDKPHLPRRLGGVRCFERGVARQPPGAPCVG